MNLSNFNDAQKEAIIHGSGPALVLAGPGSGKTTVLTRRVVYLINEKEVPPENILVVTFTKAAALEMQHRFFALVGQRLPVRFGTFHSLFYEILRMRYKSLQIMNETEATQILQLVLKQEGLDPKRTQEYKEKLTKIKNQEVDVMDNLENIVEKLRQETFLQGRIEFDDMAFECKKLLETDLEVLRKCQETYRYILVDETQDINPIQYNLIKLLALPENNLFVVGDDDQSIYSFRGAGPEIMLGFPDEYENCKRIFLNTNYRCCKDIVDKASIVIADNKKRFDKVIIPGRIDVSNELKVMKGTGKKENKINGVSIQSFTSSLEEQKWIVDQCQIWKENGQLDNSAILYRKNSDSNKIITALKNAGIPIQTKMTKTTLADSDMFRDIWNYLSFLEGDNSRALFYKIMNVPYRGISREACQGIRVYESELLSFHAYDTRICDRVRQLFRARDFTKSLSLFGRINFIIKGLEYEKYILRPNRNQSEINSDNLLLDAIKNSSFTYDTKEQWRNYLNESKIDNSSDNAKHGLHIMTYHASKGLEYKNVILPQINEGFVPYNKAKTDKEIEEERRMFYVAMTRAKDNLLISYISGTKDQPESPSRFLKRLIN